MRFPSCLEVVSTSRRRLASRLGAYGALVLAVVLGPTATKHVRADSHDKNLFTRSTVIDSGPRSCQDDPHCDDGDPCTDDRCVDGACASEEIADCIPCALETECPAIDVVFLMDTSGSMMDEAEVLCSAMSNAVSALGVEGNEIRATFLGITETPGGAFSCLTGDVVSLLGGAVPADGGSCPFPGTFSSHESWGPATAIVAERFAWTPGAARIVIPLSDEGPCNGSYPDGCNNPGDDRDAIINAKNVALTHGVVVSPITGTNSSACVNALAQDLAAMTGGTALQTQVPRSDLEAAVRTIVTQACDTNTACDDGDPCTVSDTCMPAGGCVGTPIEMVACAEQADCFDSFCDPQTGLCECADRPELCLKVVTPLPADGQCYEVSDDDQGELVVDVLLGYSVHQIIGGQFLIGYDAQSLELIEARPGTSGDPDSPFSQVLSKIIDEERGRIFYAVGATLDKFGTQGPATMATLRFRPIGACSSSELCFFDENPMITRLVDDVGTNIAFDACCSGVINIAGEGPEIICPRSRQLNADAGLLSGTTTWEPVEVISGCGGPVELSCTGPHSDGGPVGGLVETGGTFPIGTARFNCTATEVSCGLQDSCSWNVTVTDSSLVEVDVELSSPMAPGPLDRCIEFEFLPSCLEAPFVHQATLRFGLPFNFPGNARRAQFKVPAGDYACVRARDPLHTLRSAADVEIDGTKFVARFVGDPLMDGNWLLGGDLDGNGVIDVLDMAAVMGQLSRVLEPDTSCGASGPHPDINGDGIVDMLDLDFIERNLFKQDAGNCCGGGRGSAPLTDVSIKTLRAMGLGYLSRADINKDGMIDTDDLTALKQGPFPEGLKAGRAYEARKKAIQP